MQLTTEVILNVTTSTGAAVNQNAPAKPSNERPMEQISDEELEALLVTIARSATARGLRPASRLAIKMLALAVTTDGMPGRFTMTVPAKTSAHGEAGFGFNLDI